MDAVTAIKNDHRVMEALFERLKSADEDRAALVAEVKARLLAHSKAEEQHVYPELKRRDPSEAGDVHHGIEEHREAEEKLAALEAADPGTAAFDKALDEFVKAVTHHVEEEESEILPSLKDAVPPTRLDELGTTFEKRRKAELAGFGIDEDVTKDELYEKARQQDIPGRSDMTKDELSDALRAADK